VDAARFERLATEGQRALEDDDPAGALATLDSALALWRGAALADFAFDDFAQREIQRLTERQLEATEDRIDAVLQLGRHGGLVSELEALVAAHPLRERLRGQLMLALYRSGRQADALQVYKEGGRLSRELGLEPSSELRTLERAILEQDASIAAPSRASTRTDGARELPAGTITLLSSDIEGSTEVLRTVGAAAWGEILSRHRTLMRAAFEAHGGREVDTQGDAFFVAFMRAGDAVAAAVAAQRAHQEESWPGAARVAVRIGLHTGSPTTGEERYVGLDVHRVARVTSAAHGGEILCTASTAALADTHEQPGLRFVELGAFRLKDFPRPERLLRVVADGLPDSFPRPAAEPVELPQVLRRRRVLTFAAFSVVAVLAVLGTIALVRARDGPSAVAVVPPAVAVVDPDTNRVVASIPVGSKPVTITAGDGAVWVGDVKDGTVTRIDPATRKTQPIGIGAPAVDLAASEGSIWVATGGFGTVVRIDSEVGAIAERIELGDPRDPLTPAASAVAAGGGNVWVGAFDGLVRIDPRSGEITDRVDLGQTPALQVAVGGGAAWATTSASRAKRVEARSAQVTAEFYAGTWIYPIAADRTAVWVGSDAGQLWKIHPVTGATQLTAKAGPLIEGIALAKDAVWVASRDEGTLVRVDPATGDVEARIPVGGTVGEVVEAQGLVWLTVQ
jgi:class 3 adenylate cyclase/DNA-binding beta-propeller fold protein YncE